MCRLSKSRDLLRVVFSTKVMARVLTTSAEKGSGIGALEALERSPHEVVATSADPRGAGLYLADYAAVVPPVQDAAWPDTIAELVEEYSVDVVLPLNDEDLKEIDRLRSAIPAEVPFVLPRRELIRNTLDKKEAYDWFEQKGLKIPNTRTVDGYEQIPEEQYPRIIKPRWGSRARGVELVHSQDGVREYLSESEHKPADLLIQEYIDGTDYTTNLAVTADNRLLSAVIKEVMERRGYARWAATRNHANVREACVEAFEALEPAGPMNVQHMVDESGEPYLIEINPRFSGSSCLNAEAGVNEYDMLIRDAIGEEVDAKPDYETGVNLIRYHDRRYVRDEDLLTDDDRHSA